jgi:ParB-like chromosome segregation protein Spo0J
MSLDKPITVIAETNEKGFHNKYVLVDGYSRYLAAKNWLDIKYVPIKYIDIDTYLKKYNIKQVGLMQ